MGRTSTAAKAASTRSELVPIEKLYDHPDNDYSLDEQELRDLMASIKHEGLGQLPLVRPFQDGYQIIAGHRRIECYRRLSVKEPQKYDTMPVNIREDMDDTTAALLLHTTNLITRQLSPLERAERYERIWRQVPNLRKQNAKLKGVRTSEVIAEIVSKESGVSVSRATIDRALAAARKAKEVRDLVDQYDEQIEDCWKLELKQKEGFTPEVVQEIAKRTEGAQKNLWADYQRAEMTPRQLAKEIEQRSPKSDADAERLLDSMIRDARKLNAMKESGEAAIDLYRLKVLKGLLNKLSKNC